MRFAQLWVLIMGVGMIMLATQCVHEPFPPTGTGSGTDTTGTDTTGSVNDPCDSTLVYFKNDIEPILESTCAVPGCHDVQTAEDGVILTGYNNIISTADVRPGDPGGSDLFEVITETDPDKKMPPPSSGKSLTQEQIQMIQKWIAQGALNNGCDRNAGGCDSVNMSFASDIFPIIKTNCKGCHSGTNPQKNVRLETHSQIASYATNGKLLGVITHQSGSPMPYNPQDPSKPKKLDDCSISQIRSWINDGAKNN